MAVDPLTDVLKNFSPYTYNYNNPISFIDLFGEHPYTFHVRSFAAWHVFGGGFHGDDRSFSNSTEDGITSRIQQHVTLETETGLLSNKDTWNDPSSHILIPFLNSNQIHQKL